MHDNHDLDLIAEYADGSRDPAAQRLVDSCAECRAELALHREMRTLLAGAAPVAMTGDERASMRAGVRAGVDRVAPVVSLEARRGSRWLRLSSVAAAVFVTVGVAGVLTQRGGQDTAAEMATGTEETADLEAFSAQAATTAAGSAAEAAAVERSDDGESQTDTTTAADAGPEGGTDPTALDVGALTDAGTISRAELDDRVSAVIDLLVNQPDPEQLDAAWFNDREVPTPSCLDPENLPVFGVINATIDGVDVQAFVVFDSTTSEYRSTVLVTDGCTPFE